MTGTIDLDTIHLDNGSHNNPSKGHCLLEVVSMFAREPFSDSPQCVSPYLRRFGITLNDRASDARRQDLKRFIPMLPGTAGDGLDEARRWLAADHVTRVSLPRWLDAAGLGDHAAVVRGLPPITGRASYQASRDVVGAARSAASALRDEKLGGSLYDYVYGRVRKAVSEALAKKQPAATAADDAAAAAVPAYGSDAYWQWRSQLRDDVYNRVRAVYEERFGDILTNSWADTLDLFERLITIGGAK